MNYLIILSLLLSIISCSKKNELKKVSPFVDFQREEILTDSRSEITQFPILKLMSLKEIEFIVSNHLNESLKKKKLQLNQGSFLRSRMKRIIQSSSLEELSIDDLFRFENHLTEKAKTELFSELRFEKLGDQNIEWSTKFRISSEFTGKVKNLSYSVSFYNNINNQFIDKEYYDLYRYENQDEVIELTNSAIKTYQFNSSNKKFKKVGDKLISNHFVIYEIEDFEFQGRSLKDWKKDVLTEMTILIISAKGMERIVYINNNETFFEALMRSDSSAEISINGNVKKIFGRSGNWKVIGKISDKVESGNVIGLFLNDFADSSPKSSTISQQFNQKQIIVTQRKMDKVNLFIQGSATKYEISRWHEDHAVHRTEEVQCHNSSGVCLLYRELPILRQCEVDRREVIQSEINYDSSLILENYSLKIGHRDYSLQELKKLKIGNYYFAKGILNVEIYPFSSIAHRRNIEVSVKNSLKDIDVVQDFGTCNLRRISRGGTTSYTNFAREHLVTFSPSSYKSKIGLARRMNAFISY
jgi:hypothetical protein